MESFFLIKPGEILLKKDNQQEFIRRLRQQIHLRMAGITHNIESFPGRFFITVDENDRDRTIFVLSHCPGLNGFSEAVKCAKKTDDILAAAVLVASKAAGLGKTSFKVETRRSDKSFPLGSYEMSALAGETVLAATPSLRVDVHNPAFTINIEIRERAYVYGFPEDGPRGLPTGSSGKGLLLLSGGIDSPVAGYMMAKRGLLLECIYFHAYPYTSDEARKKVERLATRLAAWTGSLRLWVIPFTETQMAIKKNAEPEASTMMLRTAMMEAADKVAHRINAKAIITGESLGQVASQTVENLAITQSATGLPVLRPLIGIDKEDTVKTAQRIGTYEISILPYEDCCVLFSPKHPLLKPPRGKSIEAYASLGLSPLIDESIAAASVQRYGYKDVVSEYGH
ncbi:MAG: tRNA 4-thiouridine(8) synthase ThiI [Spirochaetaceae bacterium]|nr:tRNA 4-thiouridine(8) synthase ThiI [Spirochaetaceae bacterium]